MFKVPPRWSALILETSPKPSLKIFSRTKASPKFLLWTLLVEKDILLWVLTIISMLSQEKLSGEEGMGQTAGPPQANGHLPVARRPLKPEASASALDRGFSNRNAFGIQRWLRRSGMELRFCVSNKLPGDTKAAGLWSTLSCQGSRKSRVTTLYVEF